MIQNHHRRIAVDLAEEIDDRQAHRAQAAARATEVKAVAVAGHQRNIGKINHLQATWIKFDR